MRTCRSGWRRQFVTAQDRQGVERNQLWWSHRCAAVSLQRLLTLGLVVDEDGNWAIA